MRKYLLLASLLSFTSIAETYKCEHHPDWLDDRQFEANIEVIKTSNGIKAKITEVKLSESWPLNEQCDSPLLLGEKKLDGWAQGGEAKFGIPNDKECSFMVYLTLKGDEPTMLSPRKTYKVFGEKPYLARCKAI